MDNNIDLNSVTTIKKSYTRTQNYDIRYSINQDSFRVSDEFYQDNAMNMNGFTLHLAGEGNILLLSVQANEDSYFYKGKEVEGEEDVQKGESFSNSILSEKLRTLGMVPEDAEKGKVLLDLEEVGEKDGATFFKVTATETEVFEDSDENSDEDNQTEIADQEPNSSEDVEWDGETEEASAMDTEDQSQVIDLD